jgi:hypothetical protein
MHYQKPAQQFTPLIFEDSSTEDWILVVSPKQPRRLTRIQLFVINQHTINTPNATITEPPRTPSPGAETPAPTSVSDITDSPLLVTAPIPSADDTSEKATLVATIKEHDRATTPVVTSNEERPKPVEMPKAEPKSEEPKSGDQPPSASAPETIEPKPTAFGKTSAFTPVASFQKISLQKPIASPFVSILVALRDELTRDITIRQHAASLLLQGTSHRSVHSRHRR